ncbi:MAG: ImmA/IrrE family metallo-endopeptidase [Planctomycetota bacterium]|nr:MAG: ImmA/IrrE family metallo-endopeptidase [Planctomycetota bacterium]
MDTSSLKANLDLPDRLRQAREASGLTQAQVGEQLSLARASVSQIETGERQVNGIELAKLARLYGRPVEEFFALEFDAASALTTLFRAQIGEEAQPALLEAAGRSLELSRELARLERDLGIERASPSRMPIASAPAPASVLQAVQQGEAAAAAERRRLGLGIAPLPDVAELVESQGVRTLLVPLPEGVDGLTLNPPDVGACVIVSSRVALRVRRRFSWAHEYTHVLLDRSQLGMVTWAGNRKDLREVRANAFAASFLMPEQGVAEFMANLGKSRRRNVVDVFDGQTGRRIRNTQPGSDQAVQVFDVVQLALYFDVSREAALFRLANLGYLGETEREETKAKLEESGAELERLMGTEERFDAGRDGHQAFRHRLLGLLVEAVRREVATRGWARETAELAGVDAEDLERALEHAGIRRVIRRPRAGKELA